MGCAGPGRGAVILARAPGYPFRIRQPVLLPLCRMEGHGMSDTANPAVIDRPGGRHSMSSWPINCWPRQQRRAPGWARLSGPRTLVPLRRRARLRSYGTANWLALRDRYPTGVAAWLADYPPCRG